MYITMLGRQPAISIAELERLYGATQVRWFSEQSALVGSVDFDFERLGGSQKAGRVVAELKGNWQAASRAIVSAYETAWRTHAGKITLGISAYGFPVSGRDVQKTGIILKSKLKSHGVSLRLVPNVEPALNTATSHHNKLGLSDNHVELLVVRAAKGKIIVAESIGAQNITAFAARDQARPNTDAFVGMLPPKLARMMVNMAVGTTDSSCTVLDPFCGTGVILQETLLLGYNAFGTDLSDKMVTYSKGNLEWLRSKVTIKAPTPTVTQADATSHNWHLSSFPSLSVVAETYLGQPFSAPPSPAKLTEVRGNCNYIISEFLKNIGSQLDSGAHLCLAVPAWRDSVGSITHLPLISHLSQLGFDRVELHSVRHDQLLYYREGQVVARELLLLKKT